MAKNKFWLASNSPRRRELLAWLDWDLSAQAANVDETRKAGERARDYVCRVAFEKVSVPIQSAGVQDVIIAADTIVVLDEEILGKPENAAQAFDMLAGLRARSHWVYTAIAVRGRTDTILDVCCSPVSMRDYSDAEIRDYVASGDPMDKAGAYAIQNAAFDPVDNFKGCFASVMGMPLCHLERILKKMGIVQPDNFSAVCQNNLKYTCPIFQRVMNGEEIG